MSHRVTVGMGSNADGNTAVKWKRDEQRTMLSSDYVDYYYYYYLLEIAGNRRTCMTLQTVNK